MVHTVGSISIRTATQSLLLSLLKSCGSCKVNAASIWGPFFDKSVLNWQLAGCLSSVPPGCHQEECRGQSETWKRKKAEGDEGSSAFTSESCSGPIQKVEEKDSLCSKKPSDIQSQPPPVLHKGQNDQQNPKGKTHFGLEFWQKSSWELLFIEFTFWLNGRHV